MSEYAEPSAAYKTRYGVDWPIEMHDILIDLTIGKKHRLFEKELGIVFKDPGEHLLRAARALLSRDDFRISAWTEQHFHDFANYQKVITWGCASSSKSNDTALLLLLDWMVDPYDTVALLGSTTKEDLKGRSWEAVVRYHQALKNNTLGLLVPGRISRQGQSLTNEVDDGVAGSGGDKAGIHGRAINEDGRLQGAHTKFVRLVVDELAAISNHESVRTAMMNLRSGALDFRFYGLANPEDWANESCRYCIPEAGIPSVNVDTGSWMSTFGAFVRHHDGLKSPCILDPSLEDEFSFLLTNAQLAQSLKDEDGNADAPRFWKMVRGFPVPSGTAHPVVLDPKTADENHVTEAPVVYGLQPPRFLASVAGIDPAWSEGGDDAIYARARVMEIDRRIILDFSGGVDKLKILASSPLTVTRQLRDGVLQRLRDDRQYAPQLGAVAVDSSGNQGLADDLDTYVGAGCLHVNNSQRASDSQLRAADPREIKSFIYDRGTESWVVLAEFCRADMVRGLPQAARDALVSRRFAVKAGKSEPMSPLRMESKDEFAKRFKGSPNDADACALAALTAKERLGIIPFSDKPAPGAAIMLGGAVPWVPQLEEPIGQVDQQGGYTPDFGGIGLYEP